MTDWSSYVQVGCHLAETEEWETLTPAPSPWLESIRAEVLAIARAHQAMVEGGS